MNTNQIDLERSTFDGDKNLDSLYIISPFDYKGRLVLQDLETLFERSIDDYLFDNH